MIAALEGLVSGQRIGRLTELRPGLFKHPVGRHMIFYRPSENRHRRHPHPASGHGYDRHL
ncbi:MAG: hypothetical protein R3D85_09570 [Paracoccaceae bacterium]